MTEPVFEPNQGGSGILAFNLYTNFIQKNKQIKCELHMLFKSAGKTGQGTYLLGEETW